MKKLTRNIAMTLIGLCLSITPALAVTDYSGMTMEELAPLRATLSNASPEERAAFENEWRKRIQQMTKEERQKFTGPPATVPANVNAGK